MERQLGPIESIRPDHIWRYKFALDRLSGKVLDAACGCGYGSWILAHCNDVTSVDIEPEAIEYARLNYPGPSYVLGDIQQKPWSGKFDAVVSFETIEHLKDPTEVLKAFCESSNKLICSVPNENVLKFVPERYIGEKYPHRRHYTPEEFEDLLIGCGWKVAGRWTQIGKNDPVTPGTFGMFLIYECIRLSSSS